MKRLVLFICTLLCANVLLAQTEFIVGNLRYTVNSSNPTEVSVGKVDTTITTANIPETVTYEGVTYSVTSIGYNAFANCRNLTSVTIPKGVWIIDCYSFVGCTNLRVLNYNAECYIGNLGRFHGYDDPEEYHFFRDCPINEINIGEDVRKIPAYFAYNLDSLTSITISDGVDSIMNGAFENCSNLTSVNIPNSVTYIDRYYRSPFYGCSGLTSMTIDMSHIIGDTTTYYGTVSPFAIPSLQNLTLGENVTSIASGAFNGCSFLQNVICLATTPPTLADNTVFPYPNIATLTVPCGTLEAYSSATSFWNMFFAGRISEDCEGDSGLEDVEDTELSFYPNPTNSKITFSSTIKSIEVMDLSGKCLLTFSNAREINIESLPSGAYYLRLTNNDKAIMRKVIKE